MSGPQPPAYTPTPPQLAAVAEQAGLGPLRTWRALPGGVVNPVLLLNDSAVLRINVRNAADPKVAKEAWVLRFLAGQPPAAGWRVPRVLAAETSRTLLPYDYLLLEYLPGRGGVEVWSECDLGARRGLMQQLGQALAYLHARPLPGHRYGDWDAAAGALGTDEDWRKVIDRRGAQLLAAVAAHQALPAGRRAAVQGWLADHAAGVPAAPRRALVHGDLSLWNTLATEPAGPGPRPTPTITALFDFEWSQAGPPALDFVPIFYDPADRIEPAALLAGYTGGRALDAGFLREAHYYQMLYHLELLDVVHRHWGGQGGDIHEAGIARLLDGEPIWGFAAAGYGWPF